MSAEANGVRVALVTGGGRGIGRATAIALARAGTRVTVTARTRDEVAAVAAEIGGDFIAASAATPEGCAAIVEETRRRSGPIDILVCSAGIGAWGEQPIWDLTHARWRETLATNLDGPFYLSRLVTAEMTQRRFGRIVFVSSTAGEVGGPAQPAYCASKHGVIGLMRAIAQDVIPYGVTCNAVLPGWVRTRMADDDVAEESRHSGRTPEEIGPRTQPNMRRAASSTRPRWRRPSHSSARRLRAASTARHCAWRSAGSGRRTRGAQA